MPRFAANLSMMFTEVPFLDRFDAAARAGFTAVEFLFPYDHPAEAIGERLHRNGLTQALFNLPPGNWDAGEKGFAARPDKFDELQQSLHTALPYARATGVKRLHLMSGLADRHDPKALAAFRKSVTYAAEFFAPHGIDVVLEPLNRRNVPGYFLDDFGFARDQIVDLGIPNLKLQFDFYHCQILHGDVTMRLREMMPVIGHIQIASIPSRNEPDTEELNYGFLFGELDRLGYSGFVGCEYNPRGKTEDGLGWFKPYVGSEAMTLALGCIADDYTGASDLANTLTRAGLRTVQTIGVPSDDLKLPEIDAVVVSLKSRSIAAADAVAKSRAAEKWMRGRGAQHVLFKICSTFDSTDAGNIGPVMDALRAESGDASVLVTPAFPETGRTVYQGNLFVGALPLNESPLKDHPLNPMHDSNLVRVLARQSKTAIGLVDLATVTRGADAVRARLVDLAKQGTGAAIIDAVFDRDLETIGTVAIGHKLSVGASGIGLGLARALVASGRVTASSGADIGKAVGGPAACLAGSCSQATLAQIARAEQIMPVLHLDPEQVIAGPDETRRALAWAREHIGKGPVLIASSSTPDQVAALQARHGRDAAGHAIEQAMADLAEGLVQAGVRRLVVAGGETSGAAVDRLGIPGFLVGAEIAAGVPVLRAVGAREGDMLLALKSGNFGGPDFFSDALKLMS